MQPISGVLWCFIWTARGQGQQDKGCPLPQLIFGMQVAGTAMLLSLKLQSERKPMGICMAPFCPGCISGQTGEEMAHSCLHTDAIRCAKWAPARACGLEKYFHPLVLSSGDQVLWIQRDNFLSFRLHCLSYVTQLSSRVIVCLMEFLQRSNCQPSSVSLPNVSGQEEYWPKGPLIWPRGEFLVFSRLLPTALVRSHLCKSCRWSLPPCRRPELILAYAC